MTVADTLSAWHLALAIATAAFAVVFGVRRMLAAAKRAQAELLKALLADQDKKRHDMGNALTVHLGRLELGIRDHGRDVREDIGALARRVDTVIGHRPGGED